MNSCFLFRIAWLLVQAIIGPTSFIKIPFRCQSILTHQSTIRRRLPSPSFALIASSTASSSSIFTVPFVIALSRNSTVSIRSFGTPSQVQYIHTLETNSVEIRDCAEIRGRETKFENFQVSESIELRILNHQMTTSIPSLQLECKAWNEKELHVFQQFVENNYRVLPRYVNSKKYITNSAEPPTTFDKLQGYEAQFLINKDLRSLKGLIRFGDMRIEGPPGAVHGGASAAIMDAIMGTVTWESGFVAVTLNLNVNYRKFLPLNTTALLEASIDKVEGKKIYVNASIKSLDGTVVHVETTGLFYDVSDKYKK